MAIKINFEERFLHHVRDPGKVSRAPVAPTQTPPSTGAPTGVPTPTRPVTGPQTPPAAQQQPTQAPGAWQEFVGMPRPAAPPTERPAPAPPFAPPTRPAVRPTPGPEVPVTDRRAQLEREKDLFGLMAQQAGAGRGVDPRFLKSLAAKRAETDEKIKDIDLTARTDEALNFGQQAAYASYVMGASAPIFAKLPEQTKNKVVTNLIGNKPNRILTNTTHVVQHHEENPGDQTGLQGRTFVPVYRGFERLGVPPKGIATKFVKLSDLMKVIKEAEEE